MEFTTHPILRWATNITEFGLEYATRRFYGLYGATVESNEDPRQQGRVSARIGVLGVGTRNDAGVFTPDVHTKMLPPMTIYAGFEHGIYFPPEDGDAIYVSFDHGDSQVPRHVGSFWCNPELAKTAAGSHVPTEFKTDGVPTKRGIKTKYGHGMIFCDDEAGPYVAIWSGKQEKRVKGESGKAAVVRQQITLVDEDGSAIPTAGGGSVDAGIYANTNTGLRLELNDKEKTALLSGKPATETGTSSNSFEIDDSDDKITIKTKGEEGVRHEVVIDEKNQKISITTKGQQSIVIDDQSGNITITTSTGAVIIDAPGGISTGSGVAPASIVVPGSSVEKGSGTKLIEFQGDISQNILGTWETTTPSMTAASADIRLGATPASAVALCKADLIDWLASHTHIAPPLVGGISPLNPADLATLGTSAASLNLTTALKGD